MFCWEIVFVGPLTRWSKHQHPPVVIASGAEPWLWLARARMLQAFKPLARLCQCGYTLWEPIGSQEDPHDQVIFLEQYDPPIQQSP